MTAFDAFWREFLALEAGLKSYDRYQTKHADWVRDFEQLGVALERAQPGLAVEIAHGDPATLVITAEGNKALFSAVFDCVEEAPGVDGWTFDALRSRRNPNAVTSIAGADIAPDDVRIGFARSEDGSKLHVGFFVRASTGLSEEHLGMAAMICLDHVFGEYDVEMKMGGIDSKLVGKGETWPKNLYDIPDAIRAFDSYFESN